VNDIVSDLYEIATCEELSQDQRYELMLLALHDYLLPLAMAPEADAAEIARAMIRYDVPAAH
jgi:hypothetical protein